MLTAKKEFEEIDAAINTQNWVCISQKKQEDGSDVDFWGTRTAVHSDRRAYIAKKQEDGSYINVRFLKDTYWK